MTRPALPRLVAQTRILVLTQMWLLLVGILLLMLLLQALSANGPLDDEASYNLLVLLVSLLVAPILLSLSAKFIRHGWAIGWIFAVLAELDVAFILVRATLFSPFYGAAALLTAGIAGWVTVNLFRPAVLRFFFNRSRAAAETSAQPWPHAGR